MAVELFPILYLEPRVDKHNLLRGSCSDSGISSLWSTSGGMYRDGGSGGSEGDGNAAVVVMNVQVGPCTWQGAPLQRVVIMR
ncbi:hypothetical protein Tco_1037930 [Tanacetum coccineum]